MFVIIVDFDVPRTHRSRRCSAQTKLQVHRGSVAGPRATDDTYWARCSHEHHTLLA